MATLAQRDFKWRKRDELTYLCRIQPRHAQPADREAGIEAEEEHCGCDTERSREFGGGACQDGHTDSLAKSAEKHEFAAADLLDDENGDPGSNKVFRAVARCKETAEETREADAVLEDSRSVVGWDLSAVYFN